MMRYRSFVAWLVVLGVVLTGCSKKDETPGTSAASIKDASAQDRSAIESVIKAYFAADSSEKVCATIARGFEEVIKGKGAAPTIPAEQTHAASSPSCSKVIDDAVKTKDFELKPEQATVAKIFVQLDRAAAIVQAMNEQRPYFLINVPEGWRILNTTTAPPDFRELGDAIRAAQQ